SVIPLIASLSPPSGPVGTLVTIAGTNFGATQGASTIIFNGVPGNPQSWNATQIVVPVPAGATTGPVIVNVGGLASNSVLFTVTTAAPPVITGITPDVGPVGTSVTIAGTGFGSTQGASTVTFNGILAAPSSWSATSMTVLVPAGATSGCLVVTVAGLPSACIPFTVGAYPVITSISPQSGASGTSVTI